ncbi:hypothetical protein [Parascardovia denticolens]|uniref:hypothetical protein n=1 Tax=Parascardovia denticolens TaxID=78258 RepID=UPI00178C64A7|nr:hypothetical protein [Parascardovia denticolens]
MPYNPEQPRDIIGQWRDSNMEAGKHEVTDRYGRTHTYFVTEMGKLSDGSMLLGVAAKGRVMSSVKDDTPEERVHLMNDEEGHQMAVAASDEGVFAVIDEGKQGPMEPMSITRGNRFQPVSTHIDEPDENGKLHTEFGGRAAKMADRTDRKTYDTLSVLNAQKDNENAFKADNRLAGNVHDDISVAELAEKTVAARHEYQRMGLTEGQARNRNVLVYYDGDGNLQVSPAEVYDAESNTLSAGLSPLEDVSTQRGSGVAKVRLGQLTTMSRAMQAEKFDHVGLAIGEGTQVTETGEHVRNALHFQAGKVNERSGNDIRAWGTVEQHSMGSYRRRSFRERDSDGKFDKRGMSREARDRAAVDELRRRGVSDPDHPRDAAQFAECLSVRHGVSVPVSNVRQEGSSWRVSQAHGDLLYSGSGVASRYVSVRDDTGAKFAANMGRTDTGRLFKGGDVAPLGPADKAKYADFLQGRKGWSAANDEKSVIVREDGEVLEV